MMEISFAVEIVKVDCELPDAPVAELKKALTETIEQTIRDSGFDKATVKNLKLFEHGEG